MPQDNLVPSLEINGTIDPPGLKVPVTTPRHLLPDRMQKWKLRFNGVSETIATYGVDREGIPRAISVILEGRAAV